MVLKTDCAYLIISFSEKDPGFAKDHQYRHDHFDHSVPWIQPEVLVHVSEAIEDLTTVEAVLAVVVGVGPRQFHLWAPGS